MKNMSHKTNLIRAVLAFAVLAATLLTGCVVTSVYPFYHAKDVTFDPALLGVWAESGKTEAGDETWTFARTTDQIYKLTVASNSDTNEFDGRLFKLKDQMFLDLLPGTRQDANVPAHILMRIDSISPQLKMRLLNYEWLGKLIEKNPRAIRHIVVPRSAQNEGGELVLTADTAELQRFIRKHLATQDAWVESPVLQKK